MTATPKTIEELQKYVKDLLYEQHALMPFQSVVPNTFKLLGEHIAETLQNISKLTNVTAAPHTTQKIIANQNPIIPISKPENHNSQLLSPVLPSPIDVNVAYPYTQVMQHKNVDVMVNYLSATTALMFIPQDQYPRYNFVGKIIGPGGKNLQRLEKSSQCKILIRGIKSNKSYNKQMYQPLHIQIESNSSYSVQDVGAPKTLIPFEEMKKNLENCISQLLLFMVPTAEGNDTVKKTQMKELAKMKQFKKETEEPTTLMKFSPTPFSSRYAPY